MTSANVKDIEEARRWGRSLMVSGLLMIVLVSLSKIDLTESLIILGASAVLILGGYCLCHLSDDFFTRTSNDGSQ